MTNVRVIKPALAALVAAAACVGGLAFSSAQPAQADTYSDLINAQNQHAASVQREAELKQQLAGASQDLANKVLELDDLTNNKMSPRRPRSHRPTRMPPPLRTRPMPHPDVFRRAERQGDA